MVRLQKTFGAAALCLFLVTPALGTDKPTQGNSAAAVSGSILDGIPITGTVVETMNSSGYTYLQVDSPQGKIWVAIPQTTVKKGQQVTCNPGMEMKGFQSKSLNRTFETIVFSPGMGTKDTIETNTVHQEKQATNKSDTSFAAALEAENNAPAPSAGAMTSAAAMQQTSGSSGAIVPSADIAIEKAGGDNGFTVGECFTRAKELDKKTVVVRGKVMKFSPMIMGKNWLHIQDGTGNPMENSHDLVVTTMDAPEKDAVITVEGVLHANRDFGAGYTYEVIIEDAKVK